MAVQLDLYLSDGVMTRFQLLQVEALIFFILFYFFLLRY